MYTSLLMSVNVTSVYLKSCDLSRIKLISLRIKDAAQSLYGGAQILKIKLMSLSCISPKL